MKASPAAASSLPNRAPSAPPVPVHPDRKPAQPERDLAPAALVERIRAWGAELGFDDVRIADAAVDAARVPLDRLLTETDAPYMTPEPMRGMTCGPEHVLFTAERLAEGAAFSTAAVSS